MSQNGALRPIQHRAIRALLVGDIEDAAKAVGRTKRTLYRWLQDPAFREALASAEADLLADLRRGLGRLDAKALEALRVALTDDEPKTKLRAADVHLRHRERLQEVIEGVKSEVAVGLDESTRQLLAQVGMLAAHCITDPAMRDKFEDGLNALMGQAKGEI